MPNPTTKQELLAAIADGYADERIRNLVYRRHQQ